MMIAGCASIHQGEPSFVRRGVHRPGWLIAIVGLLVSGGTITAADEEFFEKSIRPILVKHCHACHGAEKHQGGLRLDRPEGWLMGGESGPAIVPGHPKKSLLIAAIRQDEGLEMPPSGPLPEQTILLLENWVARGAPAPTDSPAQNPLEAGKSHWAYQPVRSPSTFSPNDPAGSTIDGFIDAQLAEKQLDTAPQAERRNLVRRLYFDLWGLPPTPEEIDAFEQDGSPHAYENLVDRLLASPRFGERWGRHWLDVVRFAESVTLRGLVFQEAWRYRDYVIDAFHRDLPYDEFLREQIAGDLLPAVNDTERFRRLVATSFWTLGDHNLEEQDKRQLDMDIIDEQIDVLGRAVLAQTIGCARCHDHKFDPIPTKDYYALAGILANTRMLEHANVSNWIEAPLPMTPEEEALHAWHEAAIRSLNRQLQASRSRMDSLLAAHPELQDATTANLGDLPGIVVDDRQAKRVGNWVESQSLKPFIGSGYLHDGNTEKGEKTLTFTAKLPKDGRYEVRLAYTADGNRASRVPVTVFSASGERTLHIDMKQRPAIDGLFVSLGEYRFEAMGQCDVLIETENTQGHVIADAVQFLLRDGSAEEPGLQEQIADESSPHRQWTREKENVARIEKEIRNLKGKCPKPPRTMTILEQPTIRDLAIHVRGSVHSLGDVVPRGFLDGIGLESPSSLPTDQSGRIELADWITCPENPLTARVFVNRTWYWLLGSGLVPTPDNFGTMGEGPTHPDLLDHLAGTFMRDGWSTKRLVRRIVLSNVYQRSTRVSARARELDPENRYFSHANRKRLDAESLRDAMLFISGELDLTVGGPTLKTGSAALDKVPAESFRRSVYVPVVRNALPGIFNVFDFPDPSMVVGERTNSTIAPQALYLMNDPFVRGRSVAAADRLLALDLVDDNAKLDWACRSSLGRPPNNLEQAILCSMLEESSDSTVAVQAWADVFHLLWMTLDFRYADGPEASP